MQIEKAAQPADAAAQGSWNLSTPRRADSEKHTRRASLEKRSAPQARRKASKGHPVTFHAKGRRPYPTDQRRDCPFCGMNNRCSHPILQRFLCSGLLNLQRDPVRHRGIAGGNHACDPVQAFFASMRLTSFAYPVVFHNNDQTVRCLKKIFDHRFSTINPPFFASAVTGPFPAPPPAPASDGCADIQNPR